MNLLLFLLLQSSLVHHSLQAEVGPNELYADLKGGFPPGSLLTMYLNHDKSVNKSSAILIELYQNFAKSYYPRLDFGVYVWYGNNVWSKASINASVVEKEEGMGRSMFGTPAKDVWWRFDLYKLSDTTFLPFFQGFNGGVRTMPDVKDITSVHLKPNANNSLNFDKDDVYMSRRLPNLLYKPNPETVLDALNQKDVKSTKATSRTNITLAKGFPVGGKIKLSALMLSRPAVNDEIDSTASEAVISFIIADLSWYFAIRNKWSETEKKVKLYLVTAKTTGKNPEDCTGTTTSTDIVHVKLERPEDKIIKMRVYYKDGSPGGIKCEIKVLEEEAKHLNATLLVKGYHGGALLHLYKSF